MNICVVQSTIAWEDKEANYCRVARLLQKSPPKPGSLVVLAEMFATGFTMRAQVVAEPTQGPTCAFLKAIAQQYGVGVVGGVVTRQPRGRPQNQAVVVGPEGGERIRYGKQRLFSPGGEDEYYACGKRLGLFTWDGLTVAVLVCYDLRFPELFRAAVARGAEAFVIIANWPSRRQDHWKALLRARAIENQAWVVGVNRVGRAPGMCYAGGSCVIDPQGCVVLDAGNRTGVFGVGCGPEVVRVWRKDFPVLLDC
jgi:predicted amidohydrolase